MARRRNATKRSMYSRKSRRSGRKTARRGRKFFGIPIPFTSSQAQGMSKSLLLF